MTEERTAFAAELEPAALQLIDGQGHSAAEAARSLGVSAKRLCKRKRSLEGQRASRPRQRQSAAQEESHFPAKPVDVQDIIRVLEEATAPRSRRDG